MTLKTPDLAELVREVATLHQHVDDLARARSTSVVITTLAPRRLKLTRDIPVVVIPTGEDFVATFFDAGISSTGDTDEEAVANLRDLIGQTFEVLCGLPPSKLGKIPRQQLASLRAFIKSGK